MDILTAMFSFSLLYDGDCYVLWTPWWGLQWNNPSLVQGVKFNCLPTHDRIIVLDGRYGISNHIIWHCHETVGLIPTEMKINYLTTSSHSENAVAHSSTHQFIMIYPIYPIYSCYIPVISQWWSVHVGYHSALWPPPPRSLRIRSPRQFTTALQRSDVYQLVVL